MRARDLPPEGRVAIDIPMLIYVKRRDDPLNVNVTYEVPLEPLQTSEEPLHDVMQMCLSNILGTIDVVREHRLIFSDSRFNKFVILTDEIQAVSIMAPDEQTIIDALEGEGR